LSHFGPLDTIEENISTKEKGPPGAAPTKVCPDCDTVLHAAALVCPTCGKTFERNLKHEEKASDAPVLSNEPQIFTITTMAVHRHEKKGKPPTLRLSYSGATGFVIASEWLSISAEADHYAYVKAIKTLADWPGNPFTRLGDTLYLKGSDGRLMPAGFDAILEAARSLRPPKTITTVRKDQYLTITGRNHATQDSQPTG
jgi:DNA repair protein RadD